ncbi:MAG: hypothetical protein JOY59_12120, partial [Candidatus Eremiobacteraeota bacterium]|nr:hypothetical protein [Candidatus Eremiobacteraeota bacterium]
MRINPLALLALVGAVTLQTACSSSHNAGLPSIAQPAQTGQVVASNPSTRKPLDIGAFPTAIDAFPTDIGAFPTDSNAFPVCSSGNTQCHSQYRSDISPNANPNLPPSQIAGYHPSDLQNAYGLYSAQWAGQGQTVAVITAFDAPMLASDLAVYRAAFGLPPCPPANYNGGGHWKGGCLNVVYANGNQPQPSFAWDIEATLDAEMVSAICPQCNIMIVEAQDDMISSLSNAVAVAAQN